MMTRYAESTTVSSEASRAEIERILRRYGAASFAYGWDDERGSAVVQFRASDRVVRFTLPLPDPHARAFTHTPSKGLRRSEPEQEKAYEQAVRQRWRALTLCIKAKLEAVAAGITTFEDEFLAHIVLPNGETVGGWILPQVAEAYATQVMPSPMRLELPAGSSS